VRLFGGPLWAVAYNCLESVRLESFGADPGGQIMDDVVILSAARTPVGSFQGTLAGMSAVQLGSVAIAGAIERAQITPDAVEQVLMGNVLQAGEGQAPARQAALAAGIPRTTSAITVHKVCGSGMQAIMSAANDIRCGDYDVAIAGGMESMTNAPYLIPNARAGLRMGDAKLIDSMIHDGLWDPYSDIHMGNCAEMCARRYAFSREDQDAYALESYRRARTAADSGLLADEIVPVNVPQRRGEAVIVERDEEPFASQLEKMPSLRPAFEPEGSVTAANASSINDGAAALIVCGATRARELGRRPLARLLAQTSVAQEPEWFTTAPIAAINKLLARAGRKIEDIDLWEINEAFAVVPMAAMRELGLNPAQVNVNGGAVAIGHPIGASGARIAGSLIHSLRRRGGHLGVAAICIGGGEATAVLVENPDA
jgi:acetyl-CoA C-acetyltransferase